MRRLIFHIIFFVCATNILWGQTPPPQNLSVTLKDSTQIVVEVMDTVKFSPHASINSIEDLIEYMQNDTTFYKAFKNLHFNTYNAEHGIVLYDKKGTKTVASLAAETKNIYRNNCRWMNILEEQVSGNYYDKKGKPKQYTSQLYHNLFYEKDTICNEQNVLSKNYLNPKGNAVEKNIAQLKLLLFSPGTKIKGIPFIGNKASIFDPEIAKHYVFRMSEVEKNGIPCYLFEAAPKPGSEKKVIYQQFQTWFDQMDMHIVARNYHFKYDHALYDFNVAIKVALLQKGTTLLVQDMYYQGNWRVISQGRERAMFRSKFYH